MKKFIAAAVLLLVMGVGLYLSVCYGGFYLRLGGRYGPSVPFQTEGPSFQRWNGQSYDPMLLRGVDISSSLPGHYATAYAPTKEDYLRWLEAIGEMGANAVRTATVLDDDFYNALYAYNTGHTQPLYLLQGFGVSDSAGFGSKDAYDKGFLDALLRNGRGMVDVVHGRKNQAGGMTRDGSSYRKDVSPWTVGFLVGTEWSPDTISYTDHSPLHSGVYQGTYFQTTADATPFEAVMTRVMDGITRYETDKYGVQRPIGFLCDPSHDFLEYEEVYARQLSKHARTDPEHVVPLPSMVAGYFAAYQLYDFCDSFSVRLSAGQEQALGPLLKGLPTQELYGGYLELLSRYHTMPVIAAGYGFSSSRGATLLNTSPNDERTQGQRLVEVSQALESSGWAGGFLSTWQDEWERTSWNTAFAAVSTGHYLWHDLQSEGQNYGLMAFEPGTEDACVLDGSPGEWSEGDLLLERDGLRLSARYDAEGLYLLLEGVSREERVYLPLDLSPEVGSAVCLSPALTFQREADLLLCLDGTDNTRLLVQERCDPLRERFLFETEGEDPFYDPPTQNSGRFVPLGMAVRNPLLVDNLTPETRALQRLGVWETGRLVHGNGDSTSDQYNSLADFCFGANCVEIRLPWLLLNVGDPAAMGVHRDYYQYYGVELKQIKALWVGVVRFADSLTGDGFAEDFLRELELEELPVETRFTLVRYFRRHAIPGAQPMLLLLLKGETEGRGELSIAAASSLASYPGGETQQALQDALRSPNWHVRQNAARSLKTLGGTWEESRDGFSGDPYAAEMLRYILGGQAEKEESEVPMAV